jgi:HlyD family secretion protein
LSARTKAVLVPRGAFYQNTGGNWIYVLDGKNKAVKRSIGLGRQNPEYYEVLEGLQPGEKVITSSYGMFNNADEIIIK